MEKRSSLFIIFISGIYSIYSFDYVAALAGIRSVFYGLERVYYGRAELCRVKKLYKDFGDKEMVYAIKNTIIYAVFNPMLVTVLAVPLAVILNSKMKTKNFQRAAFFFPSVPSALILGYLWSYIMSPLDYGV